MSSSEWKRLPEKVRAVVVKHQQNAPVLLGELAKELGLVVKSATLRAGISGEIKHSEEAPAGFIVRVNRHEAKARQRFTLAHEIAHFLLHASILDGGIEDDILYRSSLSSTIEAEANRLAADLLMPWNLIEPRLKKYSGLSREECIAKIAEELEVSTTAMEIRLDKITTHT